MRFRTTNPALNASVFASARDSIAAPAPATSTMTIAGVVHRTAFLLFLMVGSGAFLLRADAWPVWMIGGLLGGAVVGFVIRASPRRAPMLAPFYALAEGLVLGGATRAAEQKAPGLALPAIVLTLGVLVALLVIYRAGWIRFDQNFRAMLYAAIGGLSLLYFVTFLFQLFGAGARLPWLHEGSGWALALSAYAVVCASLNLVSDFDFIEGGVQSASPKAMEWYAAFGLCVALVWLYLELLRLLMTLRRRK